MGAAQSILPFNEGRALDALSDLQTEVDKMEAAVDENKTTAKMLKLELSRARHQLRSAIREAEDHRRHLRSETTVRFMSMPAGAGGAGGGDDR